MYNKSIIHQIILLWGCTHFVFIIPVEVKKKDLKEFGEKEESSLQMTVSQVYNMYQSLGNLSSVFKCVENVTYLSAMYHMNLCIYPWLLVGITFGCMQKIMSIMKTIELE